MKRISKNGKKGGSIPEFAHPFVKGRREKKTGASRNKREILKFSCVIWRKISLGQHYVCRNSRRQMAKWYQTSEGHNVFVTPPYKELLRLAIVASAEVLAFCEYRLLLCEVEELLPGCLLGREEVERKTFASPATQSDHWGLTATIKSPHAKKTQRKTQGKPMAMPRHIQLQQ